MTRIFLIESKGMGLRDLRPEGARQVGRIDILGKHCSVVRKVS